MPRSTRVIEIPIRGGIISNETASAIGPRLLKSYNLAWGFPYPTVDSSVISVEGTGLSLPPWFLRMPQTFPAPAARTTFTSLGHARDLAFTFNSTVANRILVMGPNTAVGNAYGVWRATTGAPLLYASGVNLTTVNMAVRIPGCSVYWPNPGGGVFGNKATLFFSVGNSTDLYFLRDDWDGVTAGQQIEGMGHSGIVNAPTSVIALAVHLDRLWMAQNGGGPTSVLWYTDPRLGTSIQGTNFINISDIVTCLISGSLGNVDSSGVPHLVIGGYNSVWILDGDPTLQGSQAQLRQLIPGIGMRNVASACQTPYGVVFIGNDNDIWLIEPGMVRFRRIGRQVANEINEQSLANSQYLATAWYPPYVYITAADSQGIPQIYLLDLTNPDSPLWWGPIVTPGVLTFNPFLMRASPFLGAVTSPTGALGPNIHAIEVESVSNGLTYSAFDKGTLFSGAYPHGYGTGRVGSFETGAIEQEDHDVVLEKVMVYYNPAKTISDFAVAALVTPYTPSTSTGINEYNSQGVPIETHKAVTIPGRTITARRRFIFPSQTSPAVGRSIRLRLVGLTSRDTHILKVTAIVRFIPRQD